MTALDDSLDLYLARLEQGHYADRQELAIHLLEPEQIQTLTMSFAWHPLVQFLDGLLLDDPGSSDHHLLARAAPFAGQVFFLAHDGDSRAVFASLDALLDAADQAISQGCALTELHPPLAIPVTDQAALASLIGEALAEDQVEVAVALIPSLDLRDTRLLQTLLAHEDFYLGEAIARQVCARPAADLLPLARQCASHPHPQVAQAGERALRLCARPR